MASLNSHDVVGMTRSVGGERESELGRAIGAHLDRDTPVLLVHVAGRELCIAVVAGRRTRRHVQHPRVDPADCRVGEAKHAHQVGAAAGAVE